MEHLLYASLYGSGSGYGYGASTSQVGGGPAPLSLNVVRACVGAVKSNIAAVSSPKTTFLSNGDWRARRSARDLEKVILGAKQTGRADEEQRLTFRDGALFGTGALKVSISPDGKGVTYERTIVDEVLVDDSEAIYGKPLAIYQRRWVDRQVLAELYPEHADKIKDAERGDEHDLWVGYDVTADLVLVIEAWRLAATADGAGRHVMCVANCDLVDEDWELKTHPFAVFRWESDLSGWYGLGLGFDLCGIQLEINDLLADIQRGHHLIKGHYLIENNSKVVNQHINNDLGAIVRYQGIAPQYVPPSIIAPEIYSHLWQLYAKAYEIAGISQLAATSQKPAGLNSGAAQRAYMDQQSRRFQDVTKGYEQFVVDVDRLTRDVLRQAAKKGDPLEIRYIDKDVIQTVKLKGNDIASEQFEIVLKPSSQLPDSLAGRIETIEELAKTGIFDPEELVDLLQSPDTELISKRKNATRHFVEKAFDAILDGADVNTVAPEPEMDLERSLRVALELYMQARLDKVPGEYLDAMRRWMALVQQMLQAGKPPAPPPMPPMPPGMPPGGPIPPMPGVPPVPPMPLPAA